MYFSFKYNNEFNFIFVNQIQIANCILQTKFIGLPPILVLLYRPSDVPRMRITHIVRTMLIFRAGDFAHGLHCTYATLCRCIGMGQAA